MYKPLFKDKMRANNLIKTISVILLFPLLMKCSYQRNKENDKLDDGRVIVNHLDSLFGALSKINSNTKDFQESIVFINENIRQTIEHNITNTLILNEIQTYYNQKKHDFSFVQSADKRFAIFSWDTQKPDFPIKNIAFYVNKNKPVPTSLFGNPLRYDQIEVIENESGMPVYILGDFQNPWNPPHSYHLSAYLIQSEGIEEGKVFPNGESRVTVRCAMNDTTNCLKPHNGKTRTKSLYMAISQKSLANNNGEYVFN